MMIRSLIKHLLPPVFFLCILSPVTAQEELAGRIVQMADDPDPRVRFQAALTLGRIDGPEKIAGLLKIARRDSNDPWVRTAILTSVGDQPVALFEGLVGGGTEDSAAESDTGTRSLLKELSRVIGARRNPEEIAQVIAALDDPGLGGGNEAIRNAALEGLADGLRVAGRRPLYIAEVEAPLLAIISDDSGAGGRSALRVAEFLLRPDSPEVRELIQDSLKLAANDAPSEPERLRALRTLTLAPFDTVAEALRALLTARHSDRIQRASLDALDTFRSPEVASIVIDRWRGMSPAIRERALQMLFSRRERLLLLLEAVEEERIAATVIDAKRRAQLLGFSDERIRNSAREIFAATPEEDDPALYEKYRAAVELEGVGVQAAALFKERCAPCHRFGEEGYALAPDLTSVRSNSRETILTSILYPNRSMNPEYTDYVIETTDGRLITGIIAVSGKESIVLRRGGGEEDVVLRREIDSLRDTGLSIMPEGLTDGMSVQDMANLLTFIHELD